MSAESIARLKPISPACPEGGMPALGARQLVGIAGIDA
jgi:hypothetical protein